MLDAPPIFPSRPLPLSSTFSTCILSSCILSSFTLSPFTHFPCPLPQSSLPPLSFLLPRGTDNGSNLTKLPRPSVSAASTLRGENDDEGQGAETSPGTDAEANPCPSTPALALALELSLALALDLIPRPRTNNARDCTGAHNDKNIGVELSDLVSELPPALELALVPVRSADEGGHAATPSLHHCSKQACNCEDVYKQRAR